MTTKQFLLLVGGLMILVGFAAIGIASTGRYDMAYDLFVMRFGMIVVGIGAFIIATLGIVHVLNAMLVLLLFATSAFAGGGGGGGGDVDLGGCFIILFVLAVIVGLIYGIARLLGWKPQPPEDRR